MAVPRLIHGNQSRTPSLILIETARDDELSQNEKVLDRPAFRAHFNTVYTSCNDQDTSCAVTKLKVTRNDPPF